MQSSRHILAVLVIAMLIHHRQFKVVEIMFHWEMRNWNIGFE